MTTSTAANSSARNSRFNQWFSAISATSFTFTTLLLATYCVLVNDQIGDIILQANEPGQTLHGVGFILSLFWLSLICWWTARFIFDETARHYSGQRRSDILISSWGIKSTLAPGASASATVAAWLPRLYAAVPPLIVLSSGLYKQLCFVSISAVLVLLAVLILLVFRFALLQRLQLWAQRSVRRERTIGRLTELMARQSFWMWLTLLPYLLVTVLAIVDPFMLGRSMGAFFVVFWGLGSVLLFLTLGVYYGFAFINRLMGRQGTCFSFRPPYPVMLSILVYTALISVLFDTDNHHVRRVSVDQQEYAYADFDLAWKTFVEQLPSNVDGSESGTTVPVFFVASQGGGLRAAYWTALILSELERNIPGFSRYVFSLAGVSGGSVGNVFYAASLDAQDHGAVGIEGLTSAVGKDYLSPVTTSFLFNDLLYRFVPISAWDKLKTDRAEVLEVSWQRGFAETMGQSQMEKPMQLFYQQRQRWLPIILSLGAHQESGARLISAPFAIEPKVFIDKYDAYRLMNCSDGTLLNCDMRLSTVALNAARFPFVTPAGTLDKPCTGAAWSEKQHIIDGGYVENFGNMASLDMIRYLQRNNKLQHSQRQLVPILLVIANDQQITESMYDINRSEPYKSGSSWSLNEITNPIQGLVSNRSGNSVRNLALMLHHQAQSAGDSPMLQQHIGKAVLYDSLVFSLPPDEENEHKVPLGWWLSEDSKSFMNKQLEPGQKGWLLVKAAHCLLSNPKANDDNHAICVAN